MLQCVNMCVLKTAIVHILSHFGAAFTLCSHSIMAPHGLCVCSYRFVAALSLWRGGGGGGGGGECCGEINVMFFVA